MGYKPMQVPEFHFCYLLGRLMARSISIHRTLAGLSVAVVAATIALTSVAGAADTSIEAETMALPAAAGQAFTDTQASGGAGLLIWTDGAATGALAATATSQLVVRARGDQCQGAPIMLVKVDGQVAGTVSVTATTWQDYPLAGTWATGSHQVSVAFVGDYRNGCDRNLRVDKLTFSATSGTPEPTPAATTKVEAESMALTPSAGQRFNDDTASGGAGLLVWSNGTATTMVTGTTGQLVIRARGDLCAGAPSMSVAIDGQPAGTVSVKSQTWQDYPVAWPNGTHRVDVAFTNDYLAACDRNLRLDVLTVTTGPPALTPTPTPTATPTPTPTPPPSSGNPFAGAREYVDPQSPAAEAAQARRTSDPAGAAALDKVAVGSKADWYGDWVGTGALASTVSARVGTEIANGALPVMVAYAIPHRDCGSYSAGGMANADAYRGWIGQLAAGIGGRKAVVILEPDALAQLDCLSGADQNERTALIAGAVKTLSAQSSTSVYVDAGLPGWQPEATMASRLNAAGVGTARGFALNVSNFNTNAANETYGNNLSAMVGGKHFVVDTSRNGLGLGNTWCNPPGRALGAKFTTVTGDTLADAFTWIKGPGESDGTCNGGPPAGQFWTDYAIGLGQRS
jgi:hypothetical protein